MEATEVLIGVEVSTGGGSIVKQSERRWLTPDGMGNRCVFTSHGGDRGGY